MEIHEYQIKNLLRKEGLPVLKGGIAYTPEEAKETALALKANSFCIKAQVFCPNRSKGHLMEDPDQHLSGIVLAKTPEEVEEIAHKMLGKTLITPAQPNQGYEIQKIYIEEHCSIQKQISFSFFIDRPTQGITCALQVPDKPGIKYSLNGTKIPAHILNRIISYMQWPAEYKKQLIQILRKTYNVFLHFGALALEINPLILCTNGTICILGARLVFDSDALFRFPEIAVLAEVKPGLEREAIAHINNFRYIKLDGNIACLVNGAGLGLATIDLIKSRGGHVSCLVDVGTEPSKEAVSKAFKLALAEPDIDGILVNIFGGITRCDTIAQGLISASNEISVGMPLVVRMDGTNAKIGMRLLFESHLPFTVIQSMSEAIETIITKTQELS